MRKLKFRELLFLFLLVFTIAANYSANASSCTFTNGGVDNDWFNPLNWDCATIPGSTDDVYITSGALILNIDRSVNSLTFSGGTFEGSADLEILTTFSWDGFAKFDGTGTTTLAASAAGTISGTSSRYLYQAFVNNGVLTHSGADFRFSGDSSFQNNGTFHVNGASLEIEFDGATYDQLVVTNDITLSGELEVTFTCVVPGGTYTIISSTLGAITRTFDMETIPANYLVQYNTNSVQLVENPLPVDLVDFQAVKKPESVLLRWKTAAEWYNEYFQIERSAVGTHFASIGRVAGARTTSVAQSYDFSDKQPLAGRNYYRLQQVDFDGSFSKIVEIDFAYEDFEVQVFPNPSEGIFTIATSASNSECSGIRVYDLQGRLLLTRPRPVRHLDKLKLGHLDNGIYLLELSNQSNIPVRKMIILQR